MVGAKLGLDEGWIVLGLYNAPLGTACMSVFFNLSFYYT